MTRRRFEDVPRHPRLHLLVTPDHEAYLDGVHVEVPGGTDPRVVLSRAAIARAAQLGRPIRAVLHDTDGLRWPLVITPEGGVFQGKQPLRLRDTPPAGSDNTPIAPDRDTSGSVPRPPTPASAPNGEQQRQSQATPTPSPTQSGADKPVPPRDIDPQSVPAWPLFAISLSADGTAFVNGSPVHQPAGVDPREAAVAAAAGHIAELGLARPVRAHATDPDGTVWPLIIHPNGAATAAGEPIRPERRRRWGLRKS